MSVFVLFSAMLSAIFLGCYGSPSDTNDNTLLSRDELVGLIADLSDRVQAMRTRLYEKELKHDVALQDALEHVARETSMVRAQSNYRLDQVQKELEEFAVDSNPEPYTRSEFGCYLDRVILECPVGQTILVMSAYNGQYTYACDEGCCAPHPTDDCVESVEEYAPQDWVALKVKCDNVRTCDFINQGGLVASCADPYTANYLITYYTCVPEQSPYLTAIGFTAIAWEDRTYSSGELILFNLTMSNVGEAYGTDTSTFICPLDGLYVFSATLTSVSGYTIRGDIMHENTTVISMLADDEGLNNQGTSMAVVNCKKYDRVYVQATGTNMLVAGGVTQRPTSFSGFLAFAFPDQNEVVESVIKHDHI